MKNKLFQFTWFRIVKPFTKRKTSLSSGKPLLTAYHSYIIAQLKLAKKFNVKYVIAGDSNGENLAVYNNMIQLGKGLKEVCANIAIGGTRADQWVEYLKCEEGKEVLNILKDTTVIWNIGGNNILQGQMSKLPKSFEDLKSLTPSSFNCLIPPLVYGPIKTFIPTIEKDVQTVNSQIRKVWGYKTIDTYSPFVGKVGYLDDLVHFSDRTDEIVRIPLIISQVLFYRNMK